MTIVTSTSLSTDQEKMLGADLIRRSYLKLVAASLCKKVTMKEGTGLTAHFVRYKRMNVPLTALSDDGEDPSSSTFTIDEVTVTLDEWGDVLSFTSRAKLTTKHPLLQQCLELLADNAARVMDREVQLVWLANTNIYYGDASVTTRATVTSAMQISDPLIHKMRATMSRAGVSGRDGGVGEDAKQVAASGQVRQGGSYVGVVSPGVIADLMRVGTSMGTWAAVAMYANAKALYNAEAGTWLGVRWVESNFLPEFTLLGNTTAAVTTGNSGGITGLTATTATTGGTIADGVTIYWKVTRFDLTRGFEEAISIEHTTAATSSANTNKITFAMPSTAGYAYNVYIGSTTGNANLFLYNTSPLALSASQVVTTLTAQSTTATPANVNPDDANITIVHACYLLGAEACQWVGFYGIKVYVSQDGSFPGRVLRRRRDVGYTFFGKAMILNSDRLARFEVCSAQY